VAVLAAGDRTAFSAPSSPASLPGTASAAVVSWQPVPGADRYRIYRGTSPNGQSSFLETPSAITTFTYTGSGERAGSPPAAGTLWMVKNLVELKSAERVRIEGNVIENIWTAGQSGYAFVLTPRNQDGGAPWSRVRDVVIANNVVRHAAAGLHVTGYDSRYDFDPRYATQQTLRITVRNNLFDDIGPSWGPGGRVFLVGDGVAGVTIDHNTIMHATAAVVHAYGKPMLTFAYTNNISVHGDYGIMGDNASPGQATIDWYFPGSTIRGNVLAGGAASRYPAGNAFPTAAQWAASFASLSAGDYRLLPSSVFFTAGVDGTLPGTDFPALTAAMGSSAGGFIAVRAPFPPTAVRVLRR
jgi:hypothetical protein